MSVDSKAPLSVSRPDLAAQWHPDKNGDLTPEQVLPRSGKKVWWKCTEGPDHEWLSTPDNRTRGRDCPFCAGRKLSVTNSLATRFPEIASQWHQTKNNGVTSDQIISGTRTKYWWKCPKSPDHVWSASASDRVAKGRLRGCPFCAGRKLSVTNSFASRFPDIASTWHPFKNNGVTPDQVVSGSHERYWWKCPEGPDHEWISSPGSRTAGAKGCPFCTSNRVSVTNSLATRFPKIAAQWHPSKNNGITTEQVVSGSRTRYWWRCPEGPDHEWSALLSDRVARGFGCPFCVGRKPSVTNSLATRFPQIASQWHPSKNNGVTPDQVVSGSNKRYWWKCPEGPDHDWIAALASITTSNGGCPFCASRSVSATNSLATRFPEVASQWHPSKNNGVTPDQVISGSTIKYWWKCPNHPDHEWQANCASRTTLATGCPFCTLFPRSRQEIDLAFELILFFDYDINDHKEVIDGRIFDCDIIIRNQRIIVEFDGSYFHAKKEATDSAKTLALQNAGWNVFRVREQPLLLLSNMDVSVPSGSNMKPAANATMLKIQEVLKIEIEGLSNYLKTPGLQNGDASENYVRQLLRSESSPKWKLFSEARVWASSIGLKSYKQWEAFKNYEEFPSDVPKAPNQAYKGHGWNGWPDFLGYTAKQARHRRG